MSFLLLLAQGTPPSGGPPVAPDLDTVPFTQIIQDGGWTMYILIGMSLLTTIMVFYYLLSLRFNVIVPQRFLFNAEEAATEGDAEALYEICRRSRSPGAGILEPAARLMTEHPEVDYAAVRDAVEDAGGRQAGLLWQRIQYLMDIAVLAPMVGLFGTVLGMIEAFVSLKENFGSVKPIGLASGVSKALLTTAGGLIVGIVAMILFSYFRGRVTRIMSRLEASCNLVLQHIFFHPERMADAAKNKAKADDE